MAPRVAVEEIDAHALDRKSGGLEQIAELQRAHPVGIEIGALDQGTFHEPCREPVIDEATGKMIAELDGMRAVATVSVRTAEPADQIRKLRAEDMLKNRIAETVLD